MTNTAVSGLLVTAAKPDAKSNRSRVQVMVTGEKIRNGPYYWTLSRADLETYATDINERGMADDGSGGRIAVDYEHGEQGRGTLAAGWFLAGTAEVVDGDSGPELWAEVQWTDAGASDVKGGNYRFLSPEFSFKEKDKKTGLMTKAMEFIAATLTNRPFMEMAPVTAAVLWDDQMGFESRRDLIREALNGDVAPGAYPRYCVADLNAEKALVTDWAGDDAWVLSYTLNADGSVTIAPSSDWQPVEKQWVQAQAEAAAAAERVEYQARAAKWTTAYINNLPDSSFLHIEAGGKKKSGKTTPGSLRHFPYKDASGKVDLPHLRNAIARIPQSSLPASLKQSLQQKARLLLQSQGGNPAANERNTMTEEQLKALAAELGLDEDADAEAILSAIKEQKAKAEKAPEDDAVVLDKETMQKLTVSAAKGEEAAKKLHDLERETLLAKAVTDGKILPVQKDAYASMFDADPENVTQLIEVTPAKAFAELGSGGEGSDEDKALASAKKAAAARFSSEEADEVNPESLDLHVRAEKILADEGKPAGTYGSDDYLRALSTAQSESNS